MAVTTPTPHRSSGKEVPWFNPREMDDATLLALATGREALLTEFLQTVEHRLQGIAQGRTGEHWLVTGTRGAGKSYFLRYAQIRTAQRFSADDVQFALLPEELRNLRAPDDLLDEIRRILSLASGDRGRAAQWRNEATEALWKKALQTLLDSCSAKLLVVGIENFAQVLQRAFSSDVNASLLRKLMEHEPRILFLASAVDGSFDEEYQQRLFLQFGKHPLPVWDASAHKAYLTQRSKLMGRLPTRRQLARIDAYSRYTGGNARIAAILAAAILDETDMLRTSDDLNTTLDQMSDYYRASLDRMPPNTETLFDALVRGGEPCSQTQLAERVGAKQNDISRAFHWLLDGGFLHAQRAAGKKETLYQVGDRLFVQWYRMRYTNPGQLSRLAVLAELLTDTLEFGEKWSWATRFAQDGESEDALLMAELGFKDCRIDIQQLRADGADISTLLVWGERLSQIHTEEQKNEPAVLRLLDLFERFAHGAAMKEEFATALQLAEKCDGYQGMGNGKELAELCMGSLGWSPMQKLLVIRNIPRFDAVQWGYATEMFRRELVELEKLMPTEGAMIDDLRKESKLGMQYPVLLSYMNSSRFLQFFFAKNENAYSDKDTAFIQTIFAGIFSLHMAANPIESLAALAEYIWSAKLLDCSQGLYIHSLDLLQALVQVGGATLAPQQLGELCAHASRFAAWAGKNEVGLSLAKQAVAYFEATSQNAKPTEGHSFALEQLGWALGTQGQWQQALDCYRQAIALYSNDAGKAWRSMGQAARCLWHLQGLDAAWSFIAQQDFPEVSVRIAAIQQLGDAVVDVQRQSGEAQAFAAGRELLDHVLVQTDLDHAKLLRALFIGMVSENLSLAVLADLAQDLTLPNSASGSTPETTPAIHALGEVLLAWIADLQARQKPAPSQAKPPGDPDLQLTLEALNEALPIYARIRLVLEPEPQLGPLATEVVRRLMGVVYRFNPQAVRG
jgi:hypothetical protein